MKRYFLLLLIAALTLNFATATENQSTNTLKHSSLLKEGNDRFAIKAQGFMGFYVDRQPHINKLDPSAPTGLMLGIEFPSLQQLPWQQYLQNPTVGLGITYMNLGSEMLGHAVAMYPYILLNCVRTEHFEMKVKLAPGLAVVSEHWYTQKDTDYDHYYDPTTNTIFGCYLNAYLNAGLNLNFPITRNFAINSEIGFIHLSNGRTCMPNVGANIFYGGVGMVATINPEKEERTPIQFPNLPYKWSLNVTAAAGAQASQITDTHKFLIASFHTGAIYNVCNWYGVGLGADVFFNDAIDRNTTRNLYSKDSRINYTTKDKIRVGVSLNNEFQFGALTAIFDWGVYMYNPSRNYFYDYVRDYCKDGLVKRPLFYKSLGAGVDEAFHYFRFGVKVRVWDNIYLQATAKTHMQIAEYVEFGVNYQIPFLREEKREEGKSIIFHHRKGWWEK